MIPSHPTSESFLPQARVGRRRRPRVDARVAAKIGAAALAAVLVAVGAFGAYRATLGKPQTVTIDGYLHGEGVVFAPAGARYSVRFTQAPRVSHSVVHAKGYDVATRSATVVTDRYSLLLREVTLSFKGMDTATAHKAAALLAQPTMQHSLALLLRSADVTRAPTVSAKVDGFPALVYRGKTAPLNGSVAAAAIFAKDKILTMLVHTDANGDAVLHEFERSLRFAKH